MLTRLHVRNYRSLRDVTIELAQLTVVTGPNGSGKSNLYRALELIQAAAAGDLSQAANRSSSGCCSTSGARCHNLEVSKLERPRGEPDAWPVHPWLSHDPSEVADVLRYPARVCWWAREAHIELAQLRCPEDEIEAESPLAKDREKIDIRSFGRLRVVLDAFSTLAVNNMAGIAALAWAGEQFIGVPVLVRSSLEACVAGMWILEPGTLDANATEAQFQLQARERGIRADLLWYNDLARAVPSFPKGEARASAKARRQQLFQQLEEIHGGDQLTIHSGGTLIDSIGSTDAPTFQQMFKDINQRFGHNGEWTSYYENLSRLSHPSPGVIEDFYVRDENYQHSPLETKRLMWVAVFGYTKFLQHVAGYCLSDGSQSFIDVWNEKVTKAWPDFFE